jgi:hypothetical protein
MPTESELRRRFHDDEPGGAIDRGAIDLRAVLRRSRARRRPRVAAAVLASSLAVVGIVVPVSISVATTHTATTTLGAGSAASAPDSAAGPVRLQGESTSGGSSSDGSGIKRAPADKINLCTGALADPAPADDGLVLTVQPVDAAAGAHDIPVAVTLTNTGAHRVTGSLSPFPAVTLSRDGVVLWHSNGPVPSLAQQIDLAPGASTAFSTTFEPVICGVEDDTQASFRADLPDAAPGDYRLSAALDFSPDPTDAASGGAAVLVTGPTSLVTLH